MFKCFPLPFCSRNLEQIDKRHCNLTSVPDDILRYTRTLEELLLDANQLQDLPKGVYRLTQLRRLTFSDNEIQRILPEIGQLVNLEELDCSRNDIAEIPDNIRHCRALQCLDCSGNPLANNLPPGIIHLRQLTQLILNDVSLAELPREIGSLSNLRILEIRENLLKILPDSIVELSKLESLDLGSNVIEQLPNHIGHLHSLKELWLDANELIKLPNDIGQLKRLQCLDVSENKLTILPDDIGDLESLTNFELSSNQIEYLPITIGQLKQRLLILKINSNSLNQLCDEIGQCLALTELILTENLLVELPKTIGNLKNLSNLNVDRNQLTQLPIEISGCESLGMLSLRDNRLTSIPSELSNLKHLHVLDLSGNRLSNLPCTILDCDLKAIWLAENQAQPMLKFQTDIDLNSGEKVLTCYLLPQQQYTSSSMDNLLNSSKTPTETNTRTGIQSPRFEDHDDDAQHERTGSVKFADQPEDIRESSLQRHNTPHPKDLQSWRKKMAKKLQNDDNLSHHDQQQHPLHSATNIDSSYPSISSGNSQTNKFQSEIMPHPRQSIDYIPPEISYDNHHDSDDNEQSGEHTVYIEKHVEFTDDLNTNEEEKESSQQQKLHRRDTPHHLKNKRILNKNNDSMTFDQILSHSPTKSSISSSRKESMPTTTRPIDLHQEEISVTLHRRSNTGLGISIAGGIGSTAYKDNDYGIFLTKVTDEGPAGQAGLLVGDKLLSVNGISLINCEHSKAVSALKTAGDTIEMVVMREVLPSMDSTLIKNEELVLKQGEIYSTIIQRDEKQNGQFGLSISSSSSTTNDNDNVYISKINNENRKSSLAIGNRLLKINGHETSNISHDQAVETINNGGNNVESTIYREKLANGNQTIIDNTIEEARIIKGNGPMGLSIVGGIDQACPPFGMEQRGVFVSKILPTGSASRTNLRIGDRILKVNGNDMTQATHLEAVQALLQSTNEVVLVVKHEPQPVGLKEITLTRQLNEALGIRINGGIDGKRINPDDPDDDGIFVTEVKESTPASGLLTVGTRILEAVNCSCSKCWFCLSQNSSSISNTSSSLSTPIDDDVSIRDYCETSLDDIVHLKGILTFNRLSKHMKRTRSTGYINKKAKQRNIRSCCLTEFFHSTKRNLSKTKTTNLSLTKQILAPIVTLKDIISTSFSISSSSSSSLTNQDKPNKSLSISILPTKIIDETPQLSCKSLSFDPFVSIISTPKPFLVHSYTSISNYRIRTNQIQHQYSFEERIHNQECQYCTNEISLSMNKIDPNNNTFEQQSFQSTNLFHAIELYLSSTNSSHDLFDISSISSEQYVSFNETKQLNRCEINEIIYAIHKDIENHDEKTEILDSLALSLRQVAEDIPNEQIEPIDEPPVEQQQQQQPEPPGLGQMLVRAVMYEIVMKLISFYLLLLMCYGHLL